MSNEADFGVARLLRPFTGFEAVYTGQAANIPIQFTEVPPGDTGGQALDNAAGTDGYSPKLLKGMKVPFGARVAVWLPDFNATMVDNPAQVPYVYTFKWRMRNLFDFRNQRIPYRITNQGSGVIDTSVAPPAARVVLPAANNSLNYVQTEPTGVNDIAITNLRIEDISPRGIGKDSPPFLPDGSRGFFQQGLFDPGTLGPAAGLPLYNVFDLTALGDELLIGAYRATDTFGTWQFGLGASDNRFSDLFGNGTGTVFPFVGIYISMGSAAT